MTPGRVATERFTALRSAAEAVARVPMRRVTDPAEIAQCVVFLASDAAASMTGACMDVNGGALMV